MDRLSIRVVVMLAMWLGHWTFGESSEIKRDERVIFFPTIGYPPADGAQWHLPIHGWIFESETNDLLRRAALNRFGRLIGFGGHETNREIFRQRAAYFLVDNERRKRISVRIGEQTYELPPSVKDGHFLGEVVVDVSDANRLVQQGKIVFQAVVPEGDQRVFSGSVHLVDAEGVSVVSDIDDTIKVSQVRQKRELLRNTFLRPFQAVDGMPKLYQRWATQGARFHFVSSSPWQLYEPIRNFAEQADYPEATYLLRRTRLKDSTLLLMFGDPQSRKIELIGGLIERFPKRKFILVGDSGERDPEAYGEVARKFPDQILAVCIRDVTGEAADSPRYKATFEGIPAERCFVFRNADELNSVWGKY